MKNRYLTKSRFKLALECPTKLYYSGKKEYANSQLDDSFLIALSEGGFQVGELAKQYYAPGVNVGSLDYEEAEDQTNIFLQEKNITIFEAAIRFKNLFIRIDVLVKKGNKISLIEVKAKSFDPSEDDDQFVSKKSGGIKSNWEPYLYDIAFQKHVLENAYPNFEINSYLLLADKTALCPTDGLNQKFKIVKDENSRTGVVVSNNLNQADLASKILVQVPVDEYVDIILNNKTPFASKTEKSFKKEVVFLAQQYEKDLKINSEIGSKCSHCEFKCTPAEELQGLKSGFKECWATELGWGENDFKDENVLGLWNFRKKDELIKNDKIKLVDLDSNDIDPKSDSRTGLSVSERQWLQVEKVQSKDTTPFFDKEGLNAEVAKFQWPLHCIDFETSAVAIPFSKGRRPYEGIAFQFSHHTLHGDGTVEHAGQYLNVEMGQFPNYDFIRELKRQLEKDEGSIFCYSPHENTYLNLIYRQLKEDQSQIPDKDDLCKFINSITSSVGSSAESWSGKRKMIDLWHLVKRYYYDPDTKGSNSIKYILPAILNSSNFLKEKYSKPIYGAKGGIQSLNFQDWTWVQMVGGKVVDPYLKLPKLFQDVTDKNLQLLTDDNELRNGGAALTAYARMQFTEMSDYERKELSQALLKYCELDTMSMCLILEAWLDWIKN
ncbi:MAG: DUF2779 domain-containing protein [Bacteriovoracaceae bacterium]|nr:DUF2779 domain-containing protein [Bacteriovoracaceae bacterium]